MYQPVHSQSTAEALQDDETAVNLHTSQPKPSQTTTCTQSEVLNTGILLLQLCTSSGAGQQHPLKVSQAYSPCIHGEPPFDQESSAEQYLYLQLFCGIRPVPFDMIRTVCSRLWSRFFQYHIYEVIFLGVSRVYASTVSCFWVFCFRAGGANNSQVGQVGQSRYPCAESVYTSTYRLTNGSCLRVGALSWLVKT